MQAESQPHGDTCNHSSVGVLVVQDGRYLLFQREKFPIKKAPCAGHVDEADGLSGVPVGAPSEEPAFRAAAVRELKEETGLEVRPRNLKLALTKASGNECRRPPVDGSEPWHLWRVYYTTAPAGQTPRGNAAESSGLCWYTPAEIAALPDLEPVWREMLEEIHII